MLMREYPRTNKYDPTDVILIDKEQGGTKQLSLGDLVSGENNPTWRAISDAEQEIATRAHAVGDYLIWENTLFRVTSPIQVGNTLVVGGNIEATSISDEITSLNTDLAITKANSILNFKWRRVTMGLNRRLRFRFPNDQFTTAFIFGTGMGVTPFTGSIALSPTGAQIHCNKNLTISGTSSDAILTCDADYYDITILSSFVFFAEFVL